MLLKLSEIVSISDFLKNWDGRQKGMITTSNSKLIQFHEFGIDSDINVTLLKNLQKYDHDTYIRALTFGLRIKYQSFDIEISKYNEYIEYISKFENGNICGVARIKNSGLISIMTEFTNRNALELLYSLFNDVKLYSNSIVNEKIKKEIITNDFDMTESNFEHYNNLLKKDKGQLINRKHHDDLINDSNEKDKKFKQTLVDLVESLEIK